MLSQDSEMKKQAGRPLIYTCVLSQAEKAASTHKEQQAQIKDLKEKLRQSCTELVEERERMAEERRALEERLLEQVLRSLDGAMVR